MAMSIKNAGLYKWARKQKKKARNVFLDVTVEARSEKLDKNIRSERVAIYSTYCGELKNLTFKRHYTRKYPSYFYSNNKEVLAKVEKWGWIPVLMSQFEVSKDTLKSAMQAKYPKALPHRLEELRRFEYTIYADDKISIDESVIDGAIQDLLRTGAPMSVPEHRLIKENVLFELVEAMKQERYVRQKDEIIAYLSEKLTKGAKIKSKLFETGVILRDMKHNKVNDINECWYREIEKCGIECQISFFFVAQKYDEIAILRPDIY
jgi:hypothetical protein